MSTLVNAISDATELLIRFDADLFQIIGLSLRVSGSALIFATAIALPLSICLCLYQFPGKRFLLILVDTLMALPPVVVGLIVFLLLSQSGPLGVLGLLYTPSAMIIAQTLLIMPLIIALALPHIRHHWQRLREQLLMLGYHRHHCIGILLHESRVALVTVTLAAFGRALAEIGAVMIVGGNIEHHTRVMTTAIASETQQGNLALALALGMILIMVALVINSVLHVIKHRYLLSSENSRL